MFEKKPKIVDEYTIEIDNSGDFLVVHLKFKLDNGKVEGPFVLVPPFAHTLSDELCIAAARATVKRTGGEVETKGDGSDA